jgi:hypothetical protein
MIPIDCFGEYIHVGTIICFAEDNQQKVGVVSSVIASNGNIKVCFYRAIGALPERISKTNRVIRKDQYNQCVIVPLTGLNEAVIMYREIKEHAMRLREGVMRGLKTV